MQCHHLSHYDIDILERLWTGKHGIVAGKDAILKKAAVYGMESAGCVLKMKCVGPYVADKYKNEIKRVCKTSLCARLAEDSEYNARAKQKQVLHRETVQSWWDSTDVDYGDGDDEDDVDFPDERDGAMTAYRPSDWNTDTLTDFRKAVLDASGFLTKNLCKYSGDVRKNDWINAVALFADMILECAGLDSKSLRRHRPVPDEASNDGGDLTICLDTRRDCDSHQSGSVTTEDVYENGDVSIDSAPAAAAAAAEATIANSGCGGIWTSTSKNATFWHRPGIFIVMERNEDLMALACRQLRGCVALWMLANKGGVKILLATFDGVGFKDIKAYVALMHHAPGKPWGKNFATDRTGVGYSLEKSTVSKAMAPLLMSGNDAQLVAWLNRSDFDEVLRDSNTSTASERSVIRTHFGQDHIAFIDGLRRKSRASSLRGYKRRCTR